MGVPTSPEPTKGSTMRRDFELIRKILFWHESPDDYKSPEDDGYTKEQVRHHVYLLIQAGILLPPAPRPSPFGKGRDYESLKRFGNATSFDDRYPQSVAWCITWEGHDFLDAMRDDTLWKKAKETVLKPAGKAAVGASFAVLLAWLKLEATQKLGIPPWLTNN
jgi:hypothetical protein